MKPSGSASMQDKKPAELGFFMPAEWNRHEATWLAWPRDPVTWPDGRIERVEEAYFQILEALLPQEKVKLLVSGEAVREKVVRGLVRRGVNDGNLAVYVREYVDSWIRDYGPTFLKHKDGRKAWCKWIFNAWGGKYETLMQDTRVFQDSSLVPYPCFDAGIILEGGSIEVNGNGTCLTTEQCLLNSNRNAHLSRAQIELILKEYLGVSNILWLAEGIVGDDTDGHIDDIARFAGPDLILAAFEENVNDENHQLLKHNWESLKAAHTPKGKSWDLVKLPMPAPVVSDGVRLPASYANFYIANSVILLPVFDDPNDAVAAAILKEVFPGRRIVPIPARDMVYGMGTLHCLSQQEPA